VWGVGLIYEEDPDGIRVHHYDERGSTVAFSDASGSVVGRIAYGPFGEVGATTGNAQSLFQFDALFGVITDPNGLNYMRTRWYSPQIKRFLTLDPLFGRLGEPASYNLYSFAGNNPILLADPDGEFFNLIAAAIGAVVGAVVGVVANFFSDLADDGKLDTPAESYAVAAGFGALAGGAIGACPACGPGGLALIGGGTGAGESVVQSVVGGETDPGKIIVAGLLGGGIGAATGGVLGVAGFAKKGFAKLEGRLFGRAGRPQAALRPQYVDPRDVSSIATRSTGGRATRGSFVRPESRHVRFRDPPSETPPNLPPRARRPPGARPGARTSGTRPESPTRARPRNARTVSSNLRDAGGRVNQRLRMARIEEARAMLNAGQVGRSGVNRQVRIYQGAVERSGRPSRQGRNGQPRGF
jgi:RHS repeat-associated protein